MGSQVLIPNEVRRRERGRRSAVKPKRERGRRSAYPQPAWGHEVLLNSRPAFTFVHCTSQSPQLKYVWRVSETSLQPRCPCGSDSLAGSATAPSYSRPGPKSGVRSWLRNLILMTIRMGSAWAGGGSRVAPMCTQQELRHSGQQLLKVQIQPSAISRSAKRSYKRACRRAILHGQTIYKGKLLRAEQQTKEHHHNRDGQRPPHHTIRTGLHVFCLNVGGLGGGLYEELLHFLDTSMYNLVLLQETKWVHDSEYKTLNWICIGSGHSKQKHAGVMIMIRRSITVAEEVKYECDLSARLL